MASLSPILNKPHSLLHQAALSHRSLPVPLDGVHLEDGDPVIGVAGSVLVLPAYPVRRTAGVQEMGHGDPTADGVVGQVASDLVVEDHGEQRPVASTVMHGRHGLEVGVLSQAGLVPGVAVLPQPQVQCLLPSQQL
jgi:hypothetical protein